ncbi:putative Multiple antibiotic resistance (MarC)-related protein [Thiocapsa sp. KS1]|jgi:multiple antibiotic resistance protein|nr:MarC family protein [Thiocapsa sp. KS1]CRI63282.1 putative Multiple antibiotic resistance (MarC)-related protein [Thiocapsa sp. KS1]
MTPSRISLLAVLLLLPSIALAADEGGYRLGFLQILGLFVVTLGPLKMIAPFGRATSRLAQAALRRLAFESVLIGTCAVVLGGGLGSLLASNWGVSTPILTICTGLIFFLIALRAVLAQYEPAMPGAPPDDAVPSPFMIAFPMVVTPYGIAGVVALVSLFQDDLDRMLQVVAALLVVMAINLITMLYVRAVLSPLSAALLQLLGAVLGVLQVALALRILLIGLRDLGLAVNLHG